MGSARVRVVVAGASGVAGRAVCALVGARGHHVVALGSDATRLGTVEAAERHVAELTDPDAVRTLARAVTDRGPVDAVLHLVGGWRAGDTAEADAWLRPRLVDTLANVIAAFEEPLTASGGRLAIVSSTAVHPGAEPTSSYARAKADAEELVAELGDRLGVAGGAATVVAIRALGADATPPELLAEHLAAWLDRPAIEVNGARLVI